MSQRFLVSTIEVAPTMLPMKQVARWISIWACASGCLIAPAVAETAPPPEHVRLAEHGDWNKQWVLGHIYRQNTSDHRQARYWLRRAADMGQPKARAEYDAHFSVAGSTAFANALKFGIAAPATLARARVATDFPDARLTMVVIDASSPVGYVFASRVAKVQLVVLDVDGALRVGSVAVGTNDAALPAAPIDLPQAVLAARRQGMTGDVESALLMVASPPGRPAIAVWTLTPRPMSAERSGSYLVAADDGRALALSGVYDGGEDQIVAIRKRVVARTHGHGGATEVADRGDCLTPYPRPEPRSAIATERAPGHPCFGPSEGASR